MATATPDQLREVVTEMDSAAQGAFSEISAIAKLALAYLETPGAYSDFEGLARVLTAIWGKATDAENHINSMAEEVACNYKDQAMYRRMHALRQANATSGKGRA